MDRAGGDESQMRKRRVLELSPHRELILRETVEIMVPGELDRRMMRRVGLDDNLPLELSPPGPTRHLSEELEGPLPCPEVGDVEAHISI